MIVEKRASQVVLGEKNLPANAGDMRRDPWVGEDTLEEGIATHSSILVWRIHGQRSLVGYSPWGRTKSYMTEAT